MTPSKPRLLSRTASPPSSLPAIHGAYDKRKCGLRLMKESDWQIFKKIKELALERFCAEALADFEEAIAKDDLSNHERYLYLYKLVENSDKQLSILFDGHSRSKAQLQLALIRSEGLVEDHELGGLSDDLLKSTRPR